MRKKEVKKRHAKSLGAVTHTHTHTLCLLNNEKGSITLFVIIAIIFFIMLLGTMYMMMKSKETTMAKEIEQIKASYEEKTNADEVYTTIANESDKYVTQGMIENLVEQKMNEKVMKIYPVGSIYISESSTNPSSFLGGEWESYGQGRTLVGVGTSDQTFTVGTTGGESTHKLTVAEMPSHAHSFSGTAQSAGSHNHNTGSSTYNYFNVMNLNNVSRRQLYGGYGTNKGYQWTSDNTSNYNNCIDATSGTGTAGAHTHSVTGTIGENGSGTVHNNMQPYIVTYMWKRIR